MSKFKESELSENLKEYQDKCNIEIEFEKSLNGKINLEDATVEYRIYFNKLEPIIYTKLKRDHLELSIRFLVHPKMVRTVENSL